MPSALPQLDNSDQKFHTPGKRPAPNPTAKPQAIARHPQTFAKVPPPTPITQTPPRQKLLSKNERKLRADSKGLTQACLPKPQDPLGPVP